MKFFSTFFLLIITSLGFSQESSSFSKVENLPNQWVKAIAQDSLGFIWIGTEDGLCRYDGNQIKTLRHSIEDENSLAANSIYDITNTSHELIIGTQGGGMSIFNTHEVRFKTINKYKEGTFSYVKKALKISKDNFSLITDEGIFIYNKVNDSLKKIGVGGINSKVAVIDSMTLWISAKNNLYKYSLAENKVIFYKEFKNTIETLAMVKKQLLVTFNNRLISFNEQGVQKEVLTEETIIHVISNQSEIVVTSKNALFHFNIDSFNLFKIKTSLQFDESDITAIFFDNDSQLWIGTTKGLFKTKSRLPMLKRRMITVHARRIIKQNEVLYVTGNNGLFKLKDTIEEKILDGNFLALQSFNNQLWATNIKGEVFKFNNDTIVKKILLPKQGEYHRVFGLVQDSLDRIWLGSWLSGVYVLNNNGDILAHFKIDTDSKTDESKIIQMYLDTKDRLWIATSAYGLFMLPKISSNNLELKSLSFKHYTYNFNNKNTINSNLLFSIEEDKKGTIWISTDLGVASYNEKDNSFNRLRINTRLFDKKIMAIRCDNTNNLWLSTISDGVYLYNQTSKKIINYTKNSGLISNAFLYTSAYYDTIENMLYLGTDAGVQTIDLSTSQKKIIKQKPIIASLTINGEVSNFVNTPYQNTIHLTHTQNNIALSFSNLDLKHASNITYRYKLDNDNWKDMNAQTIYFSNLSYNSHKLMVKANYNLDVNSTENAISTFTIVVTPPWFKTFLAYILYTIISLFFIGTMLYLFLKNKIASIKAEKTKEINILQSEMYANISHEFRTPLTVIDGLSKILQKPKDSTHVIKNAQYIERNSNQLLKLVNQMLDLVSLDAKQMLINYKKADIIIFIKTVTTYYKALAQSKNIKLQFLSKIPSLLMDFDDDKLQKIINNLLSNAIKFTPEKGIVTVELIVENKHLCIKVTDTGAGIAVKHLPNIFNRYYKTFDIDNNLGSGIGMALTKELTLLMQGRIEVQSAVNQGSQFYVWLPITTKAKERELNYTLPFVNTDTVTFEDKNEIKKLNITKTKNNLSLLIVEDNEDIKIYLKQLLQDRYHIFTASNGKEAIKIAQNKNLDIIISDISMPKMDGFELCKHIKQNAKTSHIPVVIVSARTMIDAKIKAYRLGADAYLYKPFNEQELLLIIKNLLLKQQQQISYFSNLLQLKTSHKQNADINKIDVDFIKAIQEYALHKNQNLSIDELAKKLATSRSQLHRKIKALTGKSTTNYINYIRVEKAKNVLITTTLQINEVAYEVGFDSPTYFSKTFKKLENVSPTIFRENNK